MCRFFAALALGLCSLSLVSADERRFVEAKHGKGELKYVEGVPVLIVEGTDEEIGEQFGVLAIKPTKKPLIDKLDSYMKKSGWESAYAVMLRTAPFLLSIFPEGIQKELTAASKAGDVSRNVMILTNAMPDLQKIGGCSTLIVEAERSKTKGPLFGRLLDWPPHENLADFTLVTVFKQANKNTVATITFPIILGAISGMNDKGLCLTINEINITKDGSPRSDLKGVPMLILFRQILEKCSTVAEAEKMLTDTRRTGSFLLTVCDVKGGCVFEVTTKNVIAVPACDNVCCATNHFRSEELGIGAKCRRYETLEKFQKNGEKLGVDDVKAALHEVSQKEFTVQAMVFEPAARVLHLAYGGDKSATEKKLTKLELGPIFEKGFGGESLRK